MTEDFLLACASLPMWFPPVKIAGDTYIDAVFNIGTNMDEAIRSGADELWVIWTTSQRGEWFDGFVGNFFGIFEATVVGGYKRSLARIAANNAALARGEPGEFGRVITVKEIKAEVPVHYLLNFSLDRAAEAVNRGVETARQWCDAAGIERRPGPVYTPAVPGASTRLRFSEKLEGFIGFGATEFAAGFEQGQSDKTALTLHLDICIEDLDQFLTLPEHGATLQGFVSCERLGGKRPIDRGTWHPLVDAGDITQKQIQYEMSFHDGNGGLVELTAVKYLTDRSPAGSWHEISTAGTTLSQTIGSANRATIAAGMVRSGVLQDLEQVASIRVDAPTLALRAHALSRFGAFYFGRLWDVYARHVLPVAPF
jgi:hypothetical protein